MRQSSALILGTSISQYPILSDASLFFDRIGICGPQPPDFDSNAQYHKVDLTSIIDLEQIMHSEKYQCILHCGSDIALKSAVELRARGFSTPGLEINSFQIEQILDKSKFRILLNEIGMISPNSSIIKCKEELKKWLDTRYKSGLAFIVKPIDSSGSKGVTFVDKISKFEKSFNLALSHSLSGRVIIEHYLSPSDFQICGDGIVRDGRLVFFGKGRGVCYSQSFIPLAEAFPYPTDKYDDAIANGVEKICKKLRIKNCVFNVDIIPTEEGLFFCEFTPRLAGNFLYEAIRYCWGVDLFKAQLDPSYEVSPRQPTPSITGMLHQASNIQSLYSLDTYSKHVKQLVTCKKIDKKNYEDYFKNSRTYGNCILSLSDEFIFNDMISKSPEIFRLEKCE